MRIAIHQPEYLGYLGFYNKMMNADAWVFLDNVQLVKRDFMVRNRIRGPNGAQWLSVPIRSKGRYQLIMEAEIDDEQPWRKTHWSLISRAYARAPFFEAYAKEYASIYATKWDRLVDLNVALVQLTAHLLGIQRRVFFASRLGITGTASQLNADLTLAAGGDVYLSGPMGRDYLQEDIFRERGLRVEYNDFVHPTYDQHQPEFVPYLAAIDLLFNCGPSAVEFIQSGPPMQKEARSPVE